MATKIYLHKNIYGYHEIEDHPDNFNGFAPDAFGVTFEDYIAGKWIPLSDKQAAFVKANQTASVREWIAMQLDPPPPEPSLEELKAQALAQVESRATGKLEEMYPAHKVMAAVSGFADEAETAALLLAYEDTQSSILDALNTAKAAINSATNKAAIDAAVAMFNSSIDEL
jgi:hypothetical protein